MVSRVVVRDTVRDTSAVLVIGRAGKQIRINEFALTIEQALLVVGDLLDMLKAATTGEGRQTANAAGTGSRARSAMSLAGLPDGSRTYLRA